ncbi:MAG: flagellar hook-associated protein FlgL [Woeseiaceae bacterium]|nr:flagellar hook-associated protein FlgL [Woeseiaceae bacterium]
MRVSTLGSFQNGLGLMQRLQSALDQTQRQISSGRRILTPSDDPVASARAIGIRESVARLDQFDRNANVATNRLAQEEVALQSANNVLQRVRELALQANNATQSNESREQIAVELDELLDQLVQIANQKDGTGAFLFSGNLKDTQPVSRTPFGFVYNGDQGQRFIQIGEGRQVADGDSGADVFFSIKDGNGTFRGSPVAGNTGSGTLGTNSLVDPSAWVPDQYTVTFSSPDVYEVRDGSALVVSIGPFQPGDTISFRGIEFAIDGQPDAGDEFLIEPSGNVDVFSAVEQLVSAVRTPVSDDASRAALTNGLNSSLQSIDQGIGRVLDVRTQVGSRLVAIEGQVDSNGAQILSYRETLAGLEDLDYAEALSQLSLQATTLEAAQQSFVRTQSLSLFNFL